MYLKLLGDILLHYWALKFPNHPQQIPICIFMLIPEAIYYLLLYGVIDKYHTSNFGEQSWILLNF